MQTKDQVVLIYSGRFAGQNPFGWCRPITVRNQAKVVQETWRGDSVAHWEGDTLVIDRSASRMKLAPQVGFFHSFKLHVVERVTREGLLRWGDSGGPEVLMGPGRESMRVLDGRPNAFVPEDLPCEARLNTW